MGNLSGEKDAVRKPRVFVGSSTEGIEFARAVRKHLQKEALITLWEEGPFRMGEYLLESLEAALRDFDFAIIVVTGDDKTSYRGKEIVAPRDNVIFELGLFLGKLGRARTFMIHQRDSKIPSDLAGLTVGTFEWPRPDENFEAAVGDACSKVRKLIKKKGVRVTRQENIIKERFGDIEEAIDKAALGWTLFFVGEDESTKLGQLSSMLQLPKSSTGDQKRVESGFSYWGLGPALAWYSACSDPLYWVMFRSIKKFPEKWRKVEAKLAHLALHYVSLGAGTGEKDSTIVSSLLKKHVNVRYFPVEMTSEMLRLSLSHVLENAQVRRSRVLPIQIDFSEESNLLALRGMIDNIIGEEAVLFSLLGNTLTNFDDDVALLSSITKHLLRENDVLLLEVAWTPATENTYKEAAKCEYQNAGAFRRFAVSSLLQNTDLDINDNQLCFNASVENDGTVIKIKTFYKNTLADKGVSILGGNKFIFEEGDTIRLYLSRKYTDEGIKMLIGSSNLTCSHEESSTYRERASHCRFGVKVLVLHRTDSS